MTRIKIDIKIPDKTPPVIHEKDVRESRVKIKKPDFEKHLDRHRNQKRN